MKDFEQAVVLLFGPTVAFVGVFDLAKSTEMRFLLQSAQAKRSDWSLSEPNSIWSSRLISSDDIFVAVIISRITDRVEIDDRLVVGDIVLVSRGDFL